MPQEMSTPRGAGQKNTVKRAAVALWLALTIVTWNVVFDREVWTAADRFTRESVERYQRGETVPTINEAYRPTIRIAARRASLWASGVLALGAAALVVGVRSSRRSVLS
jgi:hypothetical protein